MTEEQKEILLTDLSARLPYGVKCAEVYPDGNKFENEWDIIRISKYVEDGIHISNCKTIYGYCSQIQNIKPYLFPITTLTDEQLEEFYCNFVENEISFNDFKKYYNETTSYFELLTKVSDCPYVLEWFNKNHLDYRGLIPMGLAIDATNKNIY